MPDKQYNYRVPSSEEAPKTLSQQPVASADNMDKLTFAKHFTHRHAGSLGGIAELPEAITDNIEQNYRAFHRQLHRTRVDLEHYHND